MGGRGGAGWPLTLWVSCLNTVYNQCNPISLHKFIHTVVSVHNDVCPDLSNN